MLILKSIDSLKGIQGFGFHFSVIVNPLGVVVSVIARLSESHRNSELCHRMRWSPSAHQHKKLNDRYSNTVTNAPGFDCGKSSVLRMFGNGIFSQTFANRMCFERL